MAKKYLFTSLKSQEFLRIRLDVNLVVASLLVLTFSGCGPPVVEITPATADADRLLFDRAETAMTEENWSRAREYFVQIRDNYPQSLLRADARLGVIDTNINEGTMGSYLAALSELQEFLRLYPSHPLSAQAQHRVGVVYFRQMRGPSRDQTETRQAIQEFERFIELSVSNSDFATGVTEELLSEVRTNLREARDRLSEASFIVGRFYYRNEYFPGAIDRFWEILDDDPGYTRRDQVYFYLAGALASVNNVEEALPMFERLIDEYPETEFLEEATEQIEQLKKTVPMDDR